MPSKLQAASKRHKMPFSPSPQKANNVKIVVQVSLFVTIDLMKCTCKLYYTHKCQIYQKLSISFHLQCEDCLEWIVCYAAKTLSRAHKLQLERELEQLFYTWGVCFQDMLDIDDTVFSLVFVNDKLTCESPIQIPYYVAFADPLVFFFFLWKSEVELGIREDFYPLY